MVVERGCAACIGTSLLMEIDRQGTDMCSRVCPLDGAHGGRGGPLH